MRQVKNKKGFTLTEMMLVIAIIVILAGAVTVGLVVDYHKYNNYLKSLQGFKCVDCGYEYVDRNNPDSHPAACPKCGGGNWEKNSDGYWEYDARDWVSGIFERSANEAQVLRESIAASVSESRASREAVEASIRASQEESRRIEESERLEREGTTTSSESTGGSTTEGTTIGGGGGNVDVSGFSNISSANAPSGIQIDSAYTHSNDGGFTYKVTEDMRAYDKISVTVHTDGNTFTRGWGGNNDYSISSDGKSITFDVPKNPNWTNPFQTGYTMGFNWAFGNQNGDTTVTVSITAS